MDFPSDFGTRRVYIDAGHGAAGNPGNESAFCVDEQDFTLSLARDLAGRLAATGHFEVRTSRLPGQVVAYRARVAEAATWSAEAFISLHSDARAEAAAWTRVAGRPCYANEGHGGFSVLWSDEGALAESRRHLASSLATHLAAEGFPAYLGADYTGLYEMSAPGVFVDRHVDAKRILVLRRPVMASVIIETHNARDIEETRRWERLDTRVAFAEAVGGALVEALRPP